MIATLLSLALQAGSSQAAPESLVMLLQARDQALLDAVATGDKATWERTLTPDAVYVDENGTTMTRKELLADFSPLPPGVTGNIRIVDYKVQQVGDTALVVHRDEESKNFYGQSLFATYLTTGTWLRRRGEWKLAMIHVYVVNNDPPAIPVPSALLDEYVGRYTAAPDLAWVIRRDGDRLLGGREGRTERPLQVEVRDVLFATGQPRSRKIFQRDSEGRITGFLDRREGHDVRWTRTR